MSYQKEIMKATFLAHLYVHVPRAASSDYSRNLLTNASSWLQSTNRNNNCP